MRDNSKRMQAERFNLKFADIDERQAEILMDELRSLTEDPEYQATIKFEKIKKRKAKRRPHD